MRLTLAVLCVCPVFGATAPAASLDFTFHAVAAQVSYNGQAPQKIDLTVSVAANSADLKLHAGTWESDRYNNVKAVFFSRALGLSNGEAVTPLAVDIGMPRAQAPFQDASVLLVAGDIVNGIFNLEELSSWDRKSPIGPLRGSATASGPLLISLKNGASLRIDTLESAEPFGNVTFEARLVADSACSAPQSMPSTTFPIQGALRRISPKALFIRTAEGKPAHFRLIEKTQFHDPNGNAIRDSLLQPGDELAVVPNPDDPETALRVVLLHKRVHAAI